MLDLIGAAIAIFNLLSTWRFMLCIVLGVAGVILVASIFESPILRLTSAIALLLVAGYVGYNWQSRFERSRRRV
jgi:FtsH-binding integral membrane protein